MSSLCFISPCIPHISRSPSSFPSTLSRTRSPPSRFLASASTPSSFSSSGYPCTTPLQVDHAAHYIPNPTVATDTLRTDWHFEHPDHGFLAFVDYPTTPTTPASQGSEMLHHIQNRLLQTHIVYGPNHPILDITTILSSAINAFGSPPGFSALVMHAVDDVLRVAWLGCCGFVLIRDDAIFFRSYGAPPGAPAMERLIHSNCPSSGTISPRIPSNVVDTPVSIAATHRSDTPFTIDTTSIQTDFIQLQDNDLIIAATDGFFSNVTEDQIVAFVRPVPDSYDATLAIANNTCLGSWRYDDVEFIAYYLAIIAANFATVRTMQSYLPFPFPPGPRLDDITVMCVSASYVD